MPMQVAYTPKPESEASEILDRIEWNTKAGKLMRCDRVKNGDRWDTNRVDISTIDQPDGSVIRPAMLFDFHSGQNGWVRFSPYDEVMVGLFDALPPKPPNYLDQNGNPVMDQWGKPVAHQQMVRMRVYAPKVFGAEQPLREMSLRGAHALMAFGHLCEKIEAAPEYRAGKLPLIRWDKARIVDSKGNSVPEWTVLSWHDRPDAFAPAPAPAARAAPAAPPAAVVAAAAAQAAAPPSDLPF